RRRSRGGWRETAARAPVDGHAPRWRPRGSRARAAAPRRSPGSRRAPATAAATPHAPWALERLPPWLGPRPAWPRHDDVDEAAASASPRPFASGQTATALYVGVRQAGKRLSTPRTRFRYAAEIRWVIGPMAPSP